MKEGVIDERERGYIHYTTLCFKMCKEKVMRE